MRANKDMILREIAGETVLIPTGQTALKIHGMVALNESGAFLWKLLKTDQTEQELIQALLTEYDVDQTTAAADVTAFISRMQTVGIVE